MAKKKPSKDSRPQYKSFRLHGKYSGQTLAICVVADLIIGFVLGVMLQPTIVALVTSYASYNYPY